MTCDDLEGLFHAYVDGEFSDDERADVEAHLAQCPGCRAAVQVERAFKERVRQSGREACAGNPGCPSQLRDSLHAALVHEDRSRRLAKAKMVVAYAGLAMGAAASLFFYLRAAQEHRRAETLVNAAISYHQHQLPLDVQDAQLPRIQSFLAGKVDFAPGRIPELHNVAVIGARLSHLADRQAAYVAYGTPQRRIGLFVFDAPDLTISGGRRISDREVMLANQRGYNVAIWKDREIAYSLVSDLDEQQLLELVGSARAPVP